MFEISFLYPNFTFLSFSSIPTSRPKIAKKSLHRRYRISHPQPTAPTQGRLIPLTPTKPARAMAMAAATSRCALPLPRQPVALSIIFWQKKTIGCALFFSSHLRLPSGDSPHPNPPPSTLHCTSPQRTYPSAGSLPGSSTAAPTSSRRPTAAACASLPPAHHQRQQRRLLLPPTWLAARAR